MTDQPQTTGDLLELVRQGSLFTTGTVMDGRDMMGQIELLLSDRVTPDFITVMHSEPTVLEYEGIAGFREALTDWMSPYERFRVAIDEALVQDDKIVFLVRQIATTKHQAVEMETSSATVLWLEDGRISQAVFYLDRASALKAAGIEPGRLEAD